jgi:ABC-type multidrug transport system permease subunit
MKNTSNLRAASQLERIGRFSSAIACLEEFLQENPDYEKKELLQKKITELNGKFKKQGDSVFRLNWKVLKEIPRNIIKWILEFISGAIFEFIITLLIAVIIGLIYYFFGN